MSDDLTTAFPAGETTPGQADSRLARSAFLARLQEFGWWRDYMALRAEGWDWRKAAYIAWAASPAKGRNPATQEELATQVLGMRSDRTIRNWRKKDETIDKRVSSLLVEPMLEFRADVIDALKISASDPNPKSASDRRTFFQLVGMLGGRGDGGEKGKTAATQPEAQHDSPFANLTDEELLRVVRNLDAAADRDEPDDDE